MNNSLKYLCDPAKLAIAKEISKIIQSMIGEENSNKAEDTEQLVFDLMEKPPERKMGDYAMPCFRFAKTLRIKPQLIAESVQKKLTESNCPWVDEVKVIGAFLNIFTNKTYLANYIVPDVNSGEYFSRLKEKSGNDKTRVMVEFSQPNTHKEFHVGHGRNVCLGDSLCRIYSYNGFTVVPVNYIGDEGAHIAKCLWQMDQCTEELPATNRSEWYGKRYVEANKKLEAASDKDKDLYLKQISSILRSIEKKEGQYYNLWKTSKEDCLKDFKETYQWLDVHFDHYFFESEFSDSSQQLVDEYLKNGFFVESEGAIGKDLSDSKLGFCMVRKSDGNIPYITRDITLAKKKFDEFNIDRSIYVVGSEQIYHFSQLFKVLELMGFKQAPACFHLSYGMVVRPEGKMSSRKGNSVSFSQLKVQMIEELQGYLQRYKDEWSPAEIEETAHRLSVGAIKYGMLQSDPSREITFELKNWLSFEGNTGPYLMYTYARSQSILRKGEAAGSAADETHLNLLSHDTEFEILRGMYDFNNVCLQACETYRPSNIGQYLFDLCKTFNRFYTEVSILKAENEDVKSARLALLKSFSSTLHQGLNLLGITPPERM